MDAKDVIRKPPRRRQDRVILQFDYDCFYAQVFENKFPQLKSKPLGVKQKNLLATCNYIARSHGVKKLMPVAEAMQICPALVLVDGEDLTLFRDTSKLLFNFLRSHSWNGKAERLGFDEVFLDVSDIVEYNLSCLNLTSLRGSFFHLSSKDPESGFACDLTSPVGCLMGTSAADDLPDVKSPAYLRLALGSHLAEYLRMKLEDDFGYTSTCGISTNKVLSKLVGAKNKPRNQTTLLALEDDDVVAFMDGYNLRAVPGLGSKMTNLLEHHILAEASTTKGSDPAPSSLTVRDVRLHPTISPAFLETLLGGPGAERGIGARVWALLHGLDHTEVKEASDIPSQISIEDTYKGLDAPARITRELHKLSCSLIRRMRVDLVAANGDGDGASSETSRGRRWIARPRTLRLSVRSWPKPNPAPTGQQQQARPTTSMSRVSRSGPLPAFVFDLEAAVEDIAQQLVAEALWPLLRRLRDGQPGGWNLQLMNVCVANMVVGASDDRAGAGRDIAAMFRRQDDVLRPWKVTRADGDDDGDGDGDGDGDDVQGRRDQEDTEHVKVLNEEAEVEVEVEEEEEEESEMAWASTENSVCGRCGHSIPLFAMPAHARFHQFEG